MKKLLKLSEGAPVTIYDEQKNQLGYSLELVGEDANNRTYNTLELLLLFGDEDAYMTLIMTMALDAAEDNGYRSYVLVTFEQLSERSLWQQIKRLPMKERNLLGLMVEPPFHIDSNQQKAKEAQLELWKRRARRYETDLISCLYNIPPTEKAHYAIGR